jgi:hypothetical protein
MKNVGHQRLESHVLHAGNVLGPLEILRSTIQSTLSGIVDKVLQQGIRKQFWKRQRKIGGMRQDRECMGVWGRQ